SGSAILASKSSESGECSLNVRTSAQTPKLPSRSEGRELFGPRLIARVVPLALGLAGASARTVVAQDQPPVGLVMSLSGSITPRLAAMAEIPAGTSLQLAPGTHLTFLHYGLCKLVTVSGGALSITRTEFKADGQVLDEKDGPCPRIHTLSGTQGGTAGAGMVM